MSSAIRRRRATRIAPARFYPFISSHADHLDWSMVVDPILSDLRDEFGEVLHHGRAGQRHDGLSRVLSLGASDHGARAAWHDAADALLGARQGLPLGARRSCARQRARPSQLSGRHAACRARADRVRARLEETRKRDYAIDRDETAEGASCVAVPARIGGTLVGAIGLSGPSSRMSDQRIAQMGTRLIQISQRLAGSQR